MLPVRAGLGLLLACAGASGWAQDDSGFVAPVEDPMERVPDDPDDGGSIEGGAGPVAVTFYSAPRLMYATTASLVRSGPGTGYAQVGTIPYGSPVTVLGSADGGAWLFLEMAGGPRGFTASNLLSANRPAASGSSGAGPSGELVCGSGQVVVRMADGSSICATLR